jgi:hypothetical protein
MCHADIRSRISDALSDASKGTGQYCYIANIFGDDKSGTVVYSCGYGDDLKQCSYTINGANCTVDMANAVDVQPFTTYQVVTADTALGEAGARNSKHDLKQLQAIHDASASLGAACAVKESKNPPAEGALKLKESVAFAVDIPLREAFQASRKIKLIAPGKGASAYYPAEVLERDGPKVFKAGTPMRIDHPTRAEEAARPEGSVRDWGAVLEADAQYIANHPDGPGLYGSIKAFSDYAQMIDEKGPYAGVSIRANGSAVMEAGRPVMKEGVPVLASLISAEGVDMVTRAGAGGMFLSESARTAPITQNEGQVEMTAEEITKLVEAQVKAGVTAATSGLQLRALKGDASVLAGRTLAGVSLSEAQKQYVIANVLDRDLPLKEGAIDETKFAEVVMAEARRYGATLGNGARVTGMGLVVSEADRVKEEQAEATRLKETAASEKAEFDQMVALYESDFGMSKEQAIAAAKGRAA